MFNYIEGGKVITRRGFDMDDNSSKKQGAVTVSEEIQIAETFQEIQDYLEHKENKNSDLE